MAAVARHLAGKSALARLHIPEVGSVLAPLIEAGLVATCAVIEFEILWSTRSPDEYDTAHADRSVGYEWLATGDGADANRPTTRSPHRRRRGAPTGHGPALRQRLRHDCGVTAQPTQWIVKRGSVA